MPRRRFSAEQKVAMVREAMQPDRSIAEVGRLYDVNQNQLSRWIREYRDGAAWSNQTLVPVELVETDAQEDAVPTTSAASATVLFPSGRTRVRQLCG